MEKLQESSITEQEKKLINLIAEIVVANILKKSRESADVKNANG